MSKIKFAIASVAFWLAATTGAFCQVPGFPQTLCANCVIGHLGIGPGPSQAIPFANLVLPVIGNAFVQFTGPTAPIKRFTLPNASDTIATLAAVRTWTGAQSFSDGTLILLGSSSGSSTIKAPATGGGTATLFSGTDTILGAASPATVTNKTFDTAGAGNSFSINGLAVTANTGTGAVARATSPVFVGPTLGAAAATSTTYTGGDISFATSGRGWVGTATSDNANAGGVGEFVSASVSQVSAIALTNVTPANVTSISLTAGDWDVSGSVFFLASASGTTTYSQLHGSISTTSATEDRQPDRYAVMSSNATVLPASVNIAVKPGAERLSLAATTTIFLVCNAQFGVSTLSAWGQLRARRVR